MSGEPSLAHRFSAAMARLGPFEPNPLLGVAVSGGADSLALALLANDWARARGGSVMALVVDHGLRTASMAEALATVERLERHAIVARLLTITGLARGPGIAERARLERYRVLAAACEEIGCLHILVGHHRADQGETVMMRALGNSRSAGLAAMPALREFAHVRLLRPLLSVSPADLRTCLRAKDVGWVEDPSNHDPAALRTRLRLPPHADVRETGRQCGGAPENASPRVSAPRVVRPHAARSEPPCRSTDSAALADAAALAGRARAGAERLAADILAGRVSLYPQGYALLSPGRLHPDALSALLQTIAGALFPPPTAAVERLAAAPQPATLAGVRLLPAGRLGSGWLLIREAAAMAPSVAAAPGAVWDGRFRLTGPTGNGLRLGALGSDSTRFRSRSGLPDAILRTLPAMRDGLALVAAPHVGYYCTDCARVSVLFCPSRPMAGAPFCPALSSIETCG